MRTPFDEFLNDTRVLEAKALIEKALNDRRRQIKGIRPARPADKVAYQQLLSSFGDHRGAKLFFPYVSGGLGNGPLVELADGSVKYDLINGIGVHLGHSLPFVVSASLDGALEDTVMQGNLQQGAATLTLMQHLRELSGFPYAFLTTSGAMAVENGLKMIFQKKVGRDRLVAFENCFMGRTLALAAASDKPQYRDGLPKTISVDYIPFYDATRHHDSISEAKIALEQLIARYPGKHAGLAMELVQGEGGYHVGHTDFFKALIKVAKANGLAIFVDEVQTFGRTPSVFAYQYFGIEKDVDVVSLGKMSQVCATLFGDDFVPRPGLVSQTFTSSSSAIRASVAVMKALKEGDWFGRSGKIQCMHQYFVEKLIAISRRHPDLLCGPYGIGSLVACTPLKGEKDAVLQLLHGLFEAGVIAFVAGNSPTRLRFILPYMVLETSDVDVIMEVFEDVLVAVGAARAG